MEVCSAQRAEMDSAWGSCLTTVPRRRVRARAATDVAAGAAGQLAQDANPGPSHVRLTRPPAASPDPARRQRAGASRRFPP
jgi:hypothetical protein